MRRLRLWKVRSRLPVRGQINRNASIKIRFSGVVIVLAPSLLRAASEVSFADPGGRPRGDCSNDPAYFDRLQPMEMEAKTGQPLPAATLAEQRAECRRRYQIAVGEFTCEEQAAIRAVVALSIRQSARAIRGSPTCRGTSSRSPATSKPGFPHPRQTHRPRRKRLPLDVGDRARASRRVPLDKMELLLHEQMHVFQRANAELFDSLYMGQWGFIRAKSIVTCPWIVEHQLLNPDADRLPLGLSHPAARWHEIHLAALLVERRSRAKRMQVGLLDAGLLRDAATATEFRVEQTPDGRPKYSELLSVRAYRKVFPRSTNIYHPHEAAADLFAKLVLFDSYLSARMGEGRACREGEEFWPLAGVVPEESWQFESQVKETADCTTWESLVEL